MSFWKHATSSTPASPMTSGEQLVAVRLKRCRTAGKKQKKTNKALKQINVRLNTLFSSLKTPPIIRTEDELKQKIALLEVWSVIASTEF